MAARFLVLCALLLVCTAATAQIAGGIAFVSDYRYRGVSLSNRGPALQGYVSYDHPSGLYAGALLSTVDIARSDTLAEFYGGFTTAFSERFSGDVAVARYQYLDNGAKSYYSYNDLSIGAAFAQLRARLHYSHNYYGFPVDAVYAELSVSHQLTGRVSLLARVGELWRNGDAVGVGNGTARFNTDAKAGVAFDVRGFGIDLSLVGSDITRSRCPSGQRGCDTALVLEVSRDF